MKITNWLSIILVLSLGFFLIPAGQVAAQGEMYYIHSPKKLPISDPLGDVVELAGDNIDLRNYTRHIDAPELDILSVQLIGASSINITFAGNHENRLESDVLGINFYLVDNPFTFATYILERHSIEWDIYILHNNSHYWNVTYGKWEWGLLGDVLLPNSEINVSHGWVDNSFTIAPSSNAFELNGHDLESLYVYVSNYRNVPDGDDIYTYHDGTFDWGQPLPVLGIDSIIVVSCILGTVGFSILMVLRKKR